MACSSNSNCAIADDTLFLYLTFLRSVYGLQRGSTQRISVQFPHGRLRPYSLRCGNALADGLRHSAPSAPCMDDVAAIHNKPRAMATHMLQLRAVYRWLPTILLRFL